MKSGKNMGDEGGDGLSPLKQARRAKIVAAARWLFVERGFRGTTMEAIAEAVAMSKVTVYGYFADKDAVFLAVAEALGGEMEEAVRAELEKDGTETDRIARALIAKHGLVARVVRGSVHAAELFAAKDRTAGQVFSDLDRRIEERIAEVLRPCAGPGADRTARLLFASAQGIANHATGDAARDDDIRRVVEAVLR